MIPKIRFWRHWGLKWHFDCPPIVQVSGSFCTSKCFDMIMIACWEKVSQTLCFGIQRWRFSRLVSCEIPFIPIGFGAAYWNGRAAILVFLFTASLPSFDVHHIDAKTEEKIAQFQIKFKATQKKMLLIVYLVYKEAPLLWKSKKNSLWTAALIQSFFLF